MAGKIKLIKFTFMLLLAKCFGSKVWVKSSLHFGYSFGDKTYIKIVYHNGIYESVLDNDKESKAPQKPYSRF